MPASLRSERWALRRQSPAHDGCRPLWNWTQPWSGCTGGRYYQDSDYPSTDDRLPSSTAACGSQDPKEYRMARARDSRLEQSSAEAPALPPSMRDRVPFLLYRAAETSHSLANAMLAEIGLSARQAGILTMVTEVGPMTQKALGDALRIDRTTMVTLLDDLEEKGYVVRQRHPRDRRAFLVHATDSGRLAKLDAVRILDEQQRRFLEPLTIAERRVLAGLLRRLHEGPASGPT